MESRQSRMDKYYDDQMMEEMEELRPSRAKKNQELYKEVSTLELEDFDLNSNVSVIGDNSKNINLDDIKDILDKRYHERPRKKSFGDTDEISLPEINLDETREYDINSILEKAKEKKEVNYEEDRLKKIRNTQYDILKDLDIMNSEEEIEEKEDLKPDELRPKQTSEKEEKQLLDLIDTVTAKDLIEKESSVEDSGELDPLDILSDLRGDDESTRVMGMLAQELKEAEAENESIYKKDTLEIPMSDEESEDDEEEETEEENTNEVEVTKVNIEELKEKAKKPLKKTNTLKLDDSFIGKTTTFTQNDFDDFNDLKDDMKFTKVIIKILVFVIVIVFLVGIAILINKYLGLGLF